MKRITVLTFLAATLITMGAARAPAQSLDARIPFDFIVHNQVFPAGTYSVSPTTEHTIMIQSRDWRAHTFVLTFAADNNQPSIGRIIFTKYGNQYFLHQVLCSALDINVEIPASRLEKRAQIQSAQLPRGEVVAVLQAGVK